MARTYDLRRPLSLNEYLEMEERSSVRHEYVAGRVYAMSGATLRHGRIAFNIAAHIRDAARARGCAIVLSEVKLRAADRIYYPDVLVVCGNGLNAELIVEKPSVIVEVASPSTRATDRREKFEAYSRIPSLQTYLIVEQSRRHALVYARDSAGEWVRDEVHGEGDVRLPVLDARITIAQIYEDVQLPPLSVNEGEEWDEDGWADSGWADDEGE